jgi:hypothetical protein
VGRSLARQRPPSLPSPPRTASPYSRGGQGAEGRGEVDRGSPLARRPFLHRDALGVGGSRSSQPERPTVQVLVGVGVLDGVKVPRGLLEGWE